MPEEPRKCTACGALLDEEDLFCSECGLEAHPPADALPVVQPGVRITTHNFQCAGCGASMSYDASAGALRCPFCGSTHLEERSDAREIAPHAVVPFGHSREQAIATLRHWLGQGYWRPGDLAEQAMVVAMTPAYIPFWMFEARTHTYWTADTDQTPAGARGDWFPLAGEHQSSYTGLLVGASSALAVAETQALLPYDLSQAVPLDRVDLDNVTVERFSVPRKFARPLARSGLESMESQACQARYVPGRCRNLKVNVRVTDLASRPMLLPVWIMSYRYRQQAYRFLINGQTGRAVGQAPTSYRKIAAAVAMALLAALVILLLLAAIAAKSAGHEARRVSTVPPVREVDNAEQVVATCTAAWRFAL